MFPDKNLSNIRALIAEGEGQQLDFKYHIGSAPKIAKTLVAFANTDGGRLLIGVKDNGNIIGVESEEEVFMIELAAEQYCKPHVQVNLIDHHLDGKTVLEVYVGVSEEKPHYAKDETGKWLVFVRRKDENLLANAVLIDVLKNKKDKRETIVRYQEPEQILLSHLEKHKKITFTQFCKLAYIPPHVAQRVLVNLASIDMIEIHITPQENFFTLK
ncbi:MAG: ATP-binding protein [Bacteroidota bacterium]|nr:ATP-binding protein [Bacteroidota bacterium]